MVNYSIQLYLHRNFNTISCFSGQKPITTSLDARETRTTAPLRRVDLLAVRVPSWVRGFISHNVESYANVNKALRGSPIGDFFCSIYYMTSESNLPQVWGRT